MANEQMANEQMANEQIANEKTANDNVKKRDIYNRVFTFAVRTAKFIEKLPGTMTITEYKAQLIRSSSSIGANMAEADGTLTRKDFANKIGIARRESRESRYWLELIKNVADLKDSCLQDELGWLLKESREIMLILSAIIKNTRANL